MDGIAPSGEPAGTVLLIDDRDEPASWIARALSSYDMQVRTITALDANLDSVRTHRPDMLVAAVADASSPTAEVVRRIVDRYDASTYLPTVVVTSEAAAASLTAGRDFDLPEVIDNGSETQLLAGLIAQLTVKTLVVAVTMATSADQYSRHSGRAQPQQDMAIVACLDRFFATYDRHAPARYADVERLSVAIASAAGVTETVCDQLRTTARIYDIGQLAAPPRRTGVPSASHTAVVRHTTIGAAILTLIDQPSFRLAAQVARHHHERWDGTGFPDGLAGYSIPLAARIVAIADTFIGLTNPAAPQIDRLTPTLANEQIEHLRGDAFDPDLVDAFQLATEAAS